MRFAALLLAALLAGAASLSAEPAQRRFGEDRLPANVPELVAALRQATTHGLDPDNYGPANIERLREDPQPAARTELSRRLQRAFLDYARDLARGRLDPERVDPDWKIPRDPFAPGDVLHALDRGDSIATILARLAPQQAGYRRLQQALALYTGISAAGGWPEVPPGPELAERSRDRRVPALRRRLELTRDLTATPETEDPFWFDAGITVAVRRFQTRHALPETGRVDERTRATLNVPVQMRIAQLRAALERWRWLPRDLGARYLLVNTAGFMLEAIENGRPVFALRTIIGRTYRATPAFSARLTHLVLNPYWNVPRSIAVKDLLPLQQQDPGFLARKHIRVFETRNGILHEMDPQDIDWSQLSKDHFPYRLRQDPGPNNSLGRIKFVMPNPYDIYLHDTPSRGLFSLPVRTFSSGCVRVERPVQLAAWLLEDAHWSTGRIQRAIDSGKQQWLRLPESVPVHVVYLTAWVDEQGRVNFRNDVYKRDTALLAAFSD